jgi:glycosyltransferase involved in cell wall biosynthesis
MSPTPGSHAKPARIKVLRLITGLRVGGAEMGLLESLRQLDRQRFEPVVACLYSRGAVADRIVELGIPVYDLQMRWFSDPAGLLRLWRLLRRERPDVLHTHLFRANFWGRLLGRLAGLRAIVSTEHSISSGQIEGRKRSWLIWAADRYSALCCDKVLAVSGDVQSCLLENRIPARKVELFYNAIDTEAFACGASRAEVREEFALGTAPVAAILARLHPVKRHDLMLEAWALVLQQLPQARLLIVGAGVLEGELRHRAEKLGDAVIFAGERSDTPAILAACDVAVLASEHEMFGRVLVEAMAAARPVVATKVGGIPEIVIDGVTGLLVPFGDAAALAAALLRLLTGRELAARMGEAGRQRARECFDIRRATRRLEEIYTELSEQSGVMQ